MDKKLLVNVNILFVLFIPVYLSKPLFCLPYKILDLYLIHRFILQEDALSCGNHSMRHLLKFFCISWETDCSTWHSSGIHSTFLMCTNIFNIIHIMRNIRLYIKGLVLCCECNYSFSNNTIMCRQISCSNFRYIILPFKWFTMVWSTPLLFRGECKIKDV